MINKYSHRGAKLFYYLTNIATGLIPRVFYRNRLNSILLAATKRDDYEEILDRVNYCNKLNSQFSSGTVTIGNFNDRDISSYYFDLLQYIKYFPATNKFSYEFGDVITVPDVPTIVKSRPIAEPNSNSVIAKLDKIRHFRFVDDPYRYQDKLDQLVWRGAAYREPRVSFIQAFYNLPKTNIGQTNKPPQQVPWQKPKLSLEEQLKYKFILSVEGNDVATNLKWIMSSNSLCFMTKPKYETWFMEGRLIANHHYVLLKDDFSDMAEKIEYYIKHENEALDIVRNANNYVAKFLDQEREDITSLLVLKKYFDLSIR